MNWDRIEGNWQLFTGRIKQQWDRLTDDDLHAVNGKRHQLVGRIQSRYGLAPGEAERQLSDFQTRI